MQITQAEVKDVKVGEEICYSPRTRKGVRVISSFAGEGNTWYLATEALGVPVGFPEAMKVYVITEGS